MIMGSIPIYMRGNPHVQCVNNVFLQQLKPATSDTDALRIGIPFLTFIEQFKNTIRLMFLGS